MAEKIHVAIFGNAGTIITSRVGAGYAGHLENEFYPVFSKADLVNLPGYAMYLDFKADI